MSKAAGILFLSPTGNALFLRRTATAPDCPGCWDFPGGGQEGDESAEETARREAKEEAGKIPDGTLIFHTRTISRSAPLKGVAGPGAPLVGVPVDGGAPAAESPPQPAVTPAVDFTTFVQKVDEEFMPELDGEHDGMAWAPVNAPPQPLHPGCQIAIDRLTMDEVGVARAIADGRLASPQQYENVMLWAIRLTGTGASYRPKVNEFVYREADIHLNPDALARWNGAPVIFQHPDKGLLTSEEFSKRVVGTVFLPYVAGDEAWGIAKIWDDDANRLMTEEDLSTSPGVNFRDFKVNRVLRLEDGVKILKEGKPSLVDHIAICQLGVWDKGGEPSGIRSEAREDSAMADEDKDHKADAAKDDAAHKDDMAKKDASAGENPDDKLSHVLDAMKAMTDAVGGLTKRMDAFEEKEKERDDAARKDAKERDDKARDDRARDDKARKDKAKKDDDETEAERMAADKAKKDAAEKEEKEEKEAKEREDAARKDSADVIGRISAVEKAVKDVGAKFQPISDDDHHLLAEAWSRTDDVCSALGQKTPRAIPGESSMQYRRRMTKQLRQFSPTWKGMKDEEFARAVTDDAAFGVVEGQIMTEAAAYARSPATAKPGILRMIEKKRDGHTIREFVGQPSDWMNSMAGATQLRGSGRFAGLDGKIPS